MKWSIAHRGIGGTVRFALGRVGATNDRGRELHPFDVRHGTDTSGLIGGADLATGHAHDVHNTAYYGMSPSRFGGAIERWRAAPPVAPEGEYTFVDLGCGKGRALLLATELPFREAIGVELNPKLAAVAEENLRRWSEAGRTRTPARVVQGDATEFAWPDGPLLVYLFNPFGEPVVERLVARMKEALQGREDLVDVIYFNPQAGDLLERGGFRQMWSETIPMDAEDAAADLVASPEDLCNGYRWVGI